MRTILLPCERPDDCPVCQGRLAYVYGKGSDPETRNRKFQHMAEDAGVQAVNAMDLKRVDEAVLWARRAARAANTLLGGWSDENPNHAG